MGKPLVLQYGGKDVPVQIEKVSRDDLYGFIDIETFDDRGQACKAAKLGSDGRSIIQTGGTAIACLSATGEWCERKSLTPVDADNKPIIPVPSTFSAPVALEQVASVDEIFSHNIASVYRINSETDYSDLAAELQAGKIFRFPFSFRGGLEADVAFLMCSADGTPFLLIGHPAKFEFVGFEQPMAAEDEFDGAEEEDESLDFSMI